MSGFSKKHQLFNSTKDYYTKNSAQLREEYAKSNIDNTISKNNYSAALTGEASQKINTFVITPRD